VVSRLRRWPLINSNAVCGFVGSRNRLPRV
jgi:hypothetical protein